MQQGENELTPFYKYHEFVSNALATVLVMGFVSNLLVTGGKHAGEGQGGKILNVAIAAVSTPVIFCIFV